jgi:hypothetical protein
VNSPLQVASTQLSILHSQIATSPVSEIRQSLSQHFHLQGNLGFERLCRRPYDPIPDIMSPRGHLLQSKRSRLNEHFESLLLPYHGWKKANVPFYLLPAEPLPTDSCTTSRKKGLCPQENIPHLRYVNYCSATAG